jgi:hypothetical protein
MYHSFALPSTLLPIILGTVQSQFNELDSTVACLAMVVTGLLSGINTFFNYGMKHQKHCDFESRYKELGDEIDLQLSKPKRHRQQADVFLEHCCQRVARLDSAAPDL